jgi:tripartite-type tricarboxylate transporter receptor subunit TctC
VNIIRRECLQLLGASAVAPFFPQLTWAQPYPSRPVNIIVGFPRGGGIDLDARLLAQWFSDRLGQRFDVENRMGSGSNVATEAVVRAPADGYTLLLATAANAISPSLYRQLNFNFIRDIAPIAGVTQTPIVLVVSPSSPLTSVAEFVAYAKANPGQASIGTTFLGSPVFLAAALFKVIAGVDVPLAQHASDAAGVADLLAGKVPVHFAGAAAVTEDINAGKLRALGISSLMRSDLLPNVPAIAEFLPGYEVSSWTGLATPRNTAPEIIELLHGETNLALHDSKLRARLAEVGQVPMPMTPTEFAKFIADETEKWGKVIRAAKFKAE